MSVDDNTKKCRAMATKYTKSSFVARIQHKNGVGNVSSVEFSQVRLAGSPSEGASSALIK
jgi:hypothetical protein